MAEAAWAKQRVGRAIQALPNGYCGLPVVKTCPHGTGTGCHFRRMRPLIPKLVRHAINVLAHSGMHSLLEWPETVWRERVLSAPGSRKASGPFLAYARRQVESLYYGAVPDHRLSTRRTPARLVRGALPALEQPGPSGQGGVRREHSGPNPR